MKVRPCFNQPHLFESTKPADHEQAKRFCARCDDIDWCRGELAKAQAFCTTEPSTRPSGTWAGELIGTVTPEQRARQAESNRRWKEKKEKQ